MSPKLLNILLFLLSIALYYGFLGPYYTGEGGLVWSPEKSIAILQNENIQFANTLNQTSMIKAAADNLNKDYKNFDPEVRVKIFTLLPDTIDPVKLRNEVLVIAAKSGVALQNLKVERDNKGDKGIAFYRVTFSGMSKYQDFKTLMEGYEKSKRFYQLDSATINRPVQDESTKVKNEIPEDQLLFNVIFRVYSVK